MAESVRVYSKEWSGEGEVYLQRGARERVAVGAVRREYKVMGGG